MVDADLHIHSNYSSDGEFGIAGIIERCLEQKVGFFSLTDHNSVKGVEEAAILARLAGIDFMPGIEIDCNYKGTDLHVLGYRVDWKSPDFLRLEETVFSKAMDSFAEMIGNINRLGFAIDAQTVLTAAGGKLPTGELIAEILLSNEKYHSPALSPYMEGGERSDMPYINFYLDYFAQGKPAFAPIDYMSYRRAIEMIKDNGGIPVVAHPGLNLRGKEHIAEELLEKGAEGLEVFNNYHDADQIVYFASLVRSRKAIMTCGSDFHGKTKPLIHIGQFKFDPRFEEYLNNSLGLLKNRI